MIEANLIGEIPYHKGITSVREKRKAVSQFL
jgi:hypothetical protein